jgi:DNA-binding NtrC family response regulator
MPEEVRVFSFDLNVESGLGKILRGIVESSRKPPVHFQEKAMEIREWASSADALSETITHCQPDLIFLILPSDQPKPTVDLIRCLDGKSFDQSVIIVREAGDPEDVLEWIRLGVVDFITPPFREIDIAPHLWRALEQKNNGRGLISSLKEKVGAKQIIGKDPTFLAEINKIPMVSNCNASVFIFGETGTGKELCGRAIHYLSPRSGKPFIPVNCGAIPTELMENELFGHMKDAFTGATRSYVGLIQSAEGGTLFLDEISCLPLQAQAKLLRFLQDKEYRQLGSTKLRQADVRIIAASNLDPEKMVSEGKLRQDLFYRLNTIPITLPPLRNRRMDIPLLSEYFLDKYASEFKKTVTHFSSAALQKIMAYEWPGNVRELENVVERAVIFCREKVVPSEGIVLPHAKNIPCQESLQIQKARVVAQFEKTYIENLLLAYQGNITLAAKAAQKNRRAFWELIRKYQINVPHFKSNILKSWIIIGLCMTNLSYLYSCGFKEFCSFV